MNLREARRRSLLVSLGATASALVAGCTESTETETEPEPATSTAEPDDQDPVPTEPSDPTPDPVVDEPLASRGELTGWAMSRGDALQRGRRGETVGVPGESPSVQWDLAVGDADRAGHTLVSAGPLVYVLPPALASAGDDVDRPPIQGHNAVHVLDATDGRLLATFTEPDSDPLTGGAALSGGTLFVGSASDVDGLDAATGEMVREYFFVYRETNAEVHRVPVVSTPAVADDLLVAFGYAEGNPFQAYVGFDVDSGDRRWSVDAGGPYRAHADPVVHEDTVYAAHLGDDLYPRVVAIDATAGEQRWATSPADARTDDRQQRNEAAPRKPVTPAVAPESAVVLTRFREGTLRGFDIESGEQRWTVSLPGGPEPVATDGDVAFTGSRDGTLRAVDTGGGTETWQFSASSDGGRWSAPALGDGVVLAGFTPEDTPRTATRTPDPAEDASGRMYAVDAETGDELWHHERPGRVTNVALDGDTIYAVWERADDPPTVVALGE